MATIEPYQTKAGKRWRVRYRKPDRSQTDKRGFKTKRDAQLFAATVETSKATGTYIDPTAGRVTIGDLGPAWLSRQGHLKATTRRDIAGAWNNHVRPHWGNTRINDIKRSHVIEWAGGLGKSRTTTSRAVGVLHGILDDAVKDRLIATNPARNIPMPRKNQKDRYYLTHEQVAMMAENSHGRDTLIYTACYLGLRWGELTGLRVMDIDFTRRRLTVAQTIHKNGSKVEVSTPKNHERRSVPIPRFISTLLAEQCDGKQLDQLVFINQQGGILSRPHMDRGWWPSMLTTAGVPAWFTPHDMRHAAASLAISSGANVKAVQRMLGHKSAAMTLDTYADLFDSDLDAVADALDAAQNFCGQNVGTNGL